MDVKVILAIFALIFLLSLVLSAPVDQKKKEKGSDGVDVNNAKEVENKIESEIDDLGLEYGRYLQQVVEALEQDKEFAKKLENVSQDDIKNGAIARELNFVNHNVRTKLDELKRIEIERLKKLAKKEHDLENGIGDPNDKRRWRTLGGDGGGQPDAAASDGVHHIDHSNPHSFEAEDLQKLILAATKDLEELDAKRREDFKVYEMEKELQYRDSLNNLTAEEKANAMKKHDEEMAKHKQHPRLNHPGSKQQLEQVWQESDKMPKEEFNPKIFFTMHDVNGDGFLDPREVEALLTLEIKKIYDSHNPEDDPNEMMEEFHRMREHIYREADSNRDGLISKKEFLDFTSRMEFERDDGWKGVGEQQEFSEEDLKKYEQHRQQLQQQYGQYGAYQAQYVPQYMPPHHQQQQHFGGQFAPPQQFAPQQYGQYGHAMPQQMHQMQQMPQMHVPNVANGHLPQQQQQQQYAMHPNMNGQPVPVQMHPNDVYYQQQQQLPPQHPQQQQQQQQHVNALPQHNPNINANMQLQQQLPPQQHQQQQVNPNSAVNQNLNPNSPQMSSQSQHNNNVNTH